MWRKGFGTREVCARLGFVEAHFPSLLSATVPGPSPPCVARGGQCDRPPQGPLELDSPQQLKILPGLPFV